MKYVLSIIAIIAPHVLGAQEAGSSWGPQYERGEIQESGPESVEDLGAMASPAPAADYYINLINRSDSVFEIGAIDNGGGLGAPFPIPRTPRNCSEAQTFDQCYNNSQWQTILATPCNSGAFQFLVCTQPDANGDCIGAIYAIAPTCDYAGGVIAID